MEEKKTRIDLFKDTGKWYDTFEVDMTPAPTYESMGELVRRTFFEKTHYTPENISHGYFLVCLEPNHPNGHPVLVKL